MTIRTPEFFYSNLWVVAFTVKRKKIFYDILKWNESGTTQSLIKSGRLIDEKPESLIPLLINGDARKLSLERNSISSMILDPPFVFGLHGKDATHQKNNIMAKEFGIFPSFRELSLLYQELIYEAYRILKKKGVLLFKCQDYTDSKTTLTHCYVHQWALNAGFKVEDVAILNSNVHKIYNPNLTQRHLRKHHSYFLVMIK